MSTTRHFLSVTDFSEAEIDRILESARHLDVSSSALKGKHLALMFEKPSMRTRSSFEVAISRLGASSTYLGKNEIDLGKREPVKDIAQVANGYYDGIVARVYSHDTLKELTKYSTIPVINALSDYEHPCQILSDLYTIRNLFPKGENVTVAYVGDCDNNIARSMAFLFPFMGIKLKMASPAEYSLDESSIEIAHSRRQNGGDISVFTDPVLAVENADIVYTDIWVSMGQSGNITEKVSLLQPFQVNPELLSHAKNSVQLMHDLPAAEGNEISEGLLESKYSIVFEQAHNRLPLQMALINFLCGISQTQNTL